MFEVRVYNSKDGSEIMRSESFATVSEAEEKKRAIGQGDGYYAIVMQPTATWEDLFTRMGVTA